MGRAWRVEYEGGLYHVLFRGNERKVICHVDRDRFTSLDAIAQRADNYDPEMVLEKAAGILNCDLDYIRHSRRIHNLG